MEQMLIVDGLKLNFEGLFKVDELHEIMDSWCADNGYDKREFENFEKMTDKGKYVQWDLRPWRTMSDYHRFTIRARVKIFDMMDVVVEKDGIKTKVNKARVNMIFDAWLGTDIEKKWDTKPMFYFIHTLFDKYMFRSAHKKMEQDLKHDVKMLMETVSSYLNMERA